jgi:hypothetical protein
MLRFAFYQNSINKAYGQGIVERVNALFIKYRDQSREDKTLELKLKDADYPFQELKYLTPEQARQIIKAHDPTYTYTEKAKKT